MVIFPPIHQPLPLPVLLILTLQNPAYSRAQHQRTPKMTHITNFLNDNFSSHLGVNSTRLRNANRNSIRIIDGIEQLRLVEADHPNNFEAIVPNFYFESSDEDALRSLIRIIGFERTNPSTPMPSFSFKENSKVVFYIHGWVTPDLSDGVQIRNGLFKNTNDVDYVILVDWRKLSPSEHLLITSAPNQYRRAATVHAPIVAELVADFILQHLDQNHFIYLIGFSLGGQIAGMAARWTAAAETNGFKIDRISGLDPAGPIFEHSFYGYFKVDKTNDALRPSDAKFVDVIHSSAKFGMNKPAGHLDIFLTQNYCTIFSGLNCVHHMAVDAFLSSLNLCSLITCPTTQLCTPQSMSSAGYLADLYGGRGIHELNLSITNAKEWNDQRCSQYMNVYLPAKKRICSDDVARCGLKPYLAQCESKCYMNFNNFSNSSGVCSIDPNQKITSNSKNYYSNKPKPYYWQNNPKSNNDDEGVKWICSNVTH